MHNFRASDRCLEGKTILVTGAGDGIGRQAALSYAQYGATVILLGKTVQKLEYVYDEIVALNKMQPAIIPLDLRGATKQNYIDMASTIEQQFGKLDGVLHNAGLFVALSPLAHIAEKDWLDIMQVNVNAPFIMTQALLPVLKKAENASIIFTSSGVGRKGRAFWGAYSTSKFAVEGLMQTIADEFENTSIRCNCINPGATRTMMRAKAYPSENVENLKTPEDIMSPYLYLMSDESVNTTGQSIDAQPKN
ncbi:YciK family oxidoreductase [Flocculibacter collagenilyticus]|uniref:YciK family oxidoreductase n=1 Tax=Flocculibacter collagenilyticus TaxID=2744479 RepID=UPI0018F29112|nr:YciK family oxidoreductase [Flocculibacter collagenilyticus]